MDNKVKNRLKHIITPFILTLICGSVTAAALIKPYDKLSMYLNLAFMDELKATPGGADSGLVIKDNDIISDFSGLTTTEGEIIRPSFGELYGMLDSKVLETSVPVYWGSSSELLERGACQSTGSAVAGDKGNTVISAHVDTFFSTLDNLKEGDSITLKTNYGDFIYKVTEKITFNKKEGKYVSTTEDDRLTLYTCKKDVLGNMDERIGVVCELKEKKFYSAAGKGEKNE